jgi:hypothetical protein
MSHISSITAAMFTDLSFCTTPLDSTVSLDWLEANLTGKLNALDAAFANQDAAGSDTKLTHALVKTAFDGGTDAADKKADVGALFANYVRITDVKEFPAIGTPANITKVPEYGSKTSKQVNGQADLNNMELTVNYVPANWKGGAIHDSDGSGAALSSTGGTNTNIPSVGDGKLYLFRFTLLGEAPASYVNGVSTSGSETGLSVKDNSIYYFIGKIEAMEVTPSLTDAVTAKLTIAIQSKISGAWTQGTL